jgi:hypothetical protein
MLHERTKLPSLSIGLDERTKTNYLFPFSLREQIRGQKPIIFSVQNPETWKIYNHLPIRSTTTHNHRSITRSNHNNINKQRRPHRRRLRKRSVREREGTRWRQRHCLMFDSFCFSTYTWNWMLICCNDTAWFVLIFSLFFSICNCNLLLLLRFQDLENDNGFFLGLHIKVSIFKRKRE